MSGRGRSASYLGSICAEGKLRGKTFTLHMNEGEYPQAIDSWHRKWRRADPKTQPEMPSIPEGAIGPIHVEPHAEASDLEETPFSAGIWLSPSDFDAAFRIVEGTLRDGYQVSVTLDVRSDRVTNDIGLATAEELDYSAGLQEFVFGFTISRSIVRNRMAGEAPIKLPPDWHKLKPSTTLRIKLDDVSFTYALPFGYLRDLHLSGRVRGSRIEQLDGCKCDLALVEYEYDEHGRYPSEAMSGDFFWNKDCRSLELTLRYRKADIEGALAGIFRARPVGVNVTLLTDVAEFQRADQTGQVCHWELHFYRADLERRIVRLERHLYYLADFSLGILGLGIAWFAWRIADEFAASKSWAWPIMAIGTWFVLIGFIRANYRKMVEKD
jgi:hypothetical protein